MNRGIKRAVKSNDKILTSIAQRLLIRMLKAHDIDFIRRGDTIISTRDKDVQRLYDQCMMDVVVTFERVGGKIHKLKEYYGYK